MFHEFNNNAHADCKTRILILLMLLGARSGQKGMRRRRQPAGTDIEKLAGSAADSTMPPQGH